MFARMDLREANGHCPRRDHYVFDQCGKCRLKVCLHCSECKIQVSGCLCSEVDRFGEDEAWKRAVDRFGEELARERYRKAGLWVPEHYGRN